MLAILIAIGWQVVRTGISQAFFRSGDLPAAYAMDHRDGIVESYLAVGLARIDAPRAAAAVARDALSQTPLAIPALGVLAVISVPTDPALAAKLLSATTALGWRDPVSQGWAARIALAGGHLDEAAAHVDAAARIQGPNGAVRALIDTMATQPAARAALVRRLLLAPGWRLAYFRDGVLPLGDLAARGALLRALSGTPVPPRRDEIGAVTNLAGATMGLDRAHALWRAIAAPASGGLVADPDFGRVSDGQSGEVPFGWIARTTPGAEAEADTPDGRGALHAMSDGTAAGTLVTQVVLVPPGRHQFSVAARFTSADAQGAFRWTLTCSNGRTMGDTVPPLAGSPTGAARFTFDIPAGPGCPVQFLSLAAEPAAMPGAVEAWYHDVHIGPPPGGS